jgi:CheY-like chemotaxis protein
VPQPRSHRDQEPAVSQGTVLVVEDDRDVRDFLLRALRVAGCAAVGAAHGREALAWLRAAARPPGLILLDLHMPVMDGWQFLSERRRDPALAAVPVAVLSASGPVAADLAPPDVIGWLPKPMPLDQLFDLVRRFCPAGDGPCQAAM